MQSNILANAISTTAADLKKEQRIIVYATILRVKVLPSTPFSVKALSGTVKFRYIWRKKRPHPPINECPAIWVTRKVLFSQLSFCAIEPP